jgi:hypothetical protein
MQTIERTGDRVFRERIAGPRIVQDGRAIRPGGIGAGAWPTARKVITDPTTYLTRDDRDKLIFVQTGVCGADVALYLPDNPVVGDTLWICIWMDWYTCSIRPGYHHAIQMPFYHYIPFSSGDPQDIICGYRILPNRALVAAYCSEMANYTPLPSTDMLTWAVMTYTGEERQVAIDYIDNNANGVVDEGDELIYGTVTLWNCWRCSGRCPGIDNWKAELEPY